jgi:hypothetical protein
MRPPNSVILINAKAAAAMLGVSARMMYDLASPHGPIPCYRMGLKCIRFDPVDLEAFMQSNSAKKRAVAQVIQIILFVSFEQCHVDAIKLRDLPDIPLLADD